MATLISTLPKNLWNFGNVLFISTHIDLQTIRVKITKPPSAPSIVAKTIIKCGSISWSCKFCLVLMGKKSASRRDSTWPLMGKIVASGRGSLENRLNHSCFTKFSSSFSINTNFKGYTTSLGGLINIAILTKASPVNDTSPRGLLFLACTLCLLSIGSLKAIKPNFVYLTSKCSPTTLAYAYYEGHHH